METIRKVHLAHHRDHKSIREIARDFNLSRNTVRKIIRSGATEFAYERKVQTRPRLEPFTERLATYLEQDSKKPVEADPHKSKEPDQAGIRTVFPQAITDGSPTNRQAPGVVVPKNAGKAAHTCDMSRDSHVTADYLGFLR